MEKIFLDEGEFDSTKIFNSAILMYLDEKYCEHHSAYQIESLVGDEVYYNVCNDCGILFLANKDNAKQT